MIEIYILMVIFIYITLQLLSVTSTLNCEDNEMESFTNTATPCKCKGGLYMSQGDSQRAKLCRKYLTTDEGKQAVMNYECNTGDRGRKNKLFEFTSYIDDNWNHNCGSNINHNICKNI